MSKLTKNGPLSYDAKLRSVVKADHYRIADYDYESTSCTGYCDDYCRCSQIINARVTNIDTYICAKQVCDKNEEDVYFVDRILAHSKFVDPNMWSVLTYGGYYGEEVDRASWDGDATLDDKLFRFGGCKTLIEKVKFVLEVEYGYLLDAIKQTTDAKIVNFKSTFLEPRLTTNRQYYQRLSQELLTKYKDMEGDMPLCVLHLKDGKYRLIDGNHRYHSNKHNKNIKAIVVE
jgi:hypothetical protein